MRIFLSQAGRYAANHDRDGPAAPPTIVATTWTRYARGNTEHRARMRGKPEARAVVSADFNRIVSAVFVRLFFFIDLISSGWL